MAEIVTTIRLNREAATALLAEARREFENAAKELWGHHAHRDESQLPALGASTEIIGRLLWTVEHSWPQEQSPIGPYDRSLVEFEFTTDTLSWLRRQRESQESYVADLDAAVDGAEPGYGASQVYLLHVLRGIETQTIGAVAS